MNISLIKNDEGIMFAQIGTDVKSKDELQKLCKSNGEEYVDFVELKIDGPEETQSLQAIETLCQLNNDAGHGFGSTIEQMLLQMYKAGLAKNKVS